MMEVVGDYDKDGFAHVRGLIPREVAEAFMTRVKAATRGAKIRISNAGLRPAVLQRAAFDLASEYFQPLNFFLWGLSPTISTILGRELLPTYSYFRIYRHSDICRVHSDRESSEHGLSLTLAYSDDEVWDLQVGKERVEPRYPAREDFGSMEYASVGMGVGDAVLYQASHYAHGRTDPNPNRWSAHLFMFYVDRNGPYREYAFDQHGDFEKVDFTFV
jgi:hypothetical protein